MASARSLRTLVLPTHSPPPVTSSCRGLGRRWIPLGVSPASFSARGCFPDQNSVVSIQRSDKFQQF